MNILVIFTIIDLLSALINFSVHSKSLEDKKLNCDSSWPIFFNPPHIKNMPITINIILIIKYFIFSNFNNL